MLACTTANQLADTRLSVAQAASSIGQHLATAPDLILVAYTEHHDPAVIHRYLSEHFPNAALLGSSTCRGLMTQDGIFGFDKPVIGCAAFADPDSAFGAVEMTCGDDTESAVRAAITHAQTAAGRSGEVPDFVWIHSSPGTEDALISGIRATLGKDVLISGGSSADETIGGKWSQFGTAGIAGDAAIALMYLDQPIVHHFQSGYLPTDQSGRVTRADGRILYEIDNKPAAEVYNVWTNGLISDALEDTSRNILGDSAWQPLGKSIGRIGPSPDLMVDCYCLMHPDSVGPDGELRLFADAIEGSKVVMMQSGPDELIRRATQVVRTSLEMALVGQPIAAALMVFCAGCMLALDDKIDVAAQQIRKSYGDVPFFGIFTFGEQGSFVNGERLHGNLMISSSLFTNSRKAEPYAS